MFDLSPPIQARGRSGISILRIDDYVESCQMWLGKGASAVDIIRIWALECEAICSGRRRRGVLPTQIDVNGDGNRGCLAGFLLFRSANDILIVDGASVGFEESTKTFTVPPENWWKCLNCGKRRLASFWKKVPVRALEAWHRRLLVSLSAVDAALDNMCYENEIRHKNRRLLESLLQEVPGGMALHSKLPPNFIKKFSFIKKAKYGAEYMEVGDAAIHDFSEQLLARRTAEMVGWWVAKMKSLKCSHIVFLRESNRDDSSVPLSVLNTSDNDISKIGEILTTSVLQNNGIDHVGVAVRGFFEEGLSPLNLSVPIERFRQICDTATYLLIGVCKRSCWASLPLIP